MSLDTSKYFLQYQLLDLSRERIEDYVAELIQASGTVNKFYNDLADLLTLSGSGLQKDGSTQLIGDWDYGPFTISGTGDIHCEDLYTSGLVHIGDYIELTDTGSALGINAPVDVGGSNAALTFSSTSGTIGVTGMGDLLVLDPDKLTINGDFIFDNNTISGTGDIHCGDLNISGDVWYEDTYWDDLRVPGLQTSLLGVRDPVLVQIQDSPGYWGVYAYGFDPTATNEVHFTVQLPHSYKEGTNIEPHVHWSPTTTESGNVRWGLEYTWANINDDFTQTVVIYDEQAATEIADRHQVMGLPTISGTGKKISSVLLCRLFRWAPLDTYSGIAALVEFDIHFEINSPGSRQEYIK